MGHHRGDRFPRKPDFSAVGSHTHFEPRHLDGSCFSHRGSCPTRLTGQVQTTVKTSSDRMVKCWIYKMEASSHVGDGWRLEKHLAHGLQLFMTHDQ
jgi:hypothetical protein